jgi:hypothetical protein
MNSLYAIEPHCSRNVEPAPLLSRPRLALIAPTFLFLLWHIRRPWRLREKPPGLAKPGVGRDTPWRSYVGTGRSSSFCEKPWVRRLFEAMRNTRTVRV